jgi:uncharacterized protein DUF6599
MSLHKYKANTRYTSFILFIALTLFAVPGITAVAELQPAEIGESLPPNLGTYHQLLSIRPLVTLAKDGILEPRYFASAPDGTARRFIGAETEYESADGQKLLVELVRVPNDSGAYSLFTLVRKATNDSGKIVAAGDSTVGAASFSTRSGVVFFEGATFARVTNESSENSRPALELARLLAANVDKGEDDVPVLVKHLPNWETEQATAVYAVNDGPLHDVISNQPILQEVNFEGGTEAVVANYGQSQLVIVEFTTPQFSVDNDSRIWTKIAELKSQGQPTPSAYRRVGNYSVFVFNAADDKTANALIDQVKYEQVVQWLGDDPHLYEKLQKYLTQTSAGVLVAVLKSSGLSLVLCLGIGGLLGALLFRHRRAQRAAAYSDAGGSIRLNLDDLTGPANSTRLLPRGEQTEHERR